MNTKLLKNYGGRVNFWAQVSFALTAILIGTLFALTGNPVLGIACVVAIGLVLNKPSKQVCALTLTVPQILTDVMDAFKLETPSIFGPNGFATDFSTKEAVLNDRLTARIASVPVTGNYDRAQGGFKAATQDVTGLITDVPVTLDTFRIVTININWITQLASRVPLYQEAIRNYGYALGKYMVDACLATITPDNFSNEVSVSLANVNLDTLDQSVRDKLNTQKAYNRGRYCLVGTPFASKFGADDRTKSSLFFNQKNGEQGYRQWNGIAGFGKVQEYSDMYAGSNLIGFAGDNRSIVVVSRPIDFSNVADQLGVPKVMDFYPMTDPETGASMVGAAWQEAGTGDVYISAGVLFGVAAGKQGGAAGSICDNAGCRIVKP